jgi:hypothetical protein
LDPVDWEFGENQGLILRVSRIASFEWEVHRRDENRVGDAKARFAQERCDALAEF